MRQQTANILGARATVTPARPISFPPQLLTELTALTRRVSMDMAGAFWLVSEAGKDGIDATTVARRLGIPLPTARYQLVTLGAGGWKRSLAADGGMGLIELDDSDTRPKPYRLTQKGRLLVNRVNKGE